MEHKEWVFEEYHERDDSEWGHSIPNPQNDKKEDSHMVHKTSAL